MGERLYRKKPGGTWYGWYYRGKRRVSVCLRTYDKPAARALLRKYDRAAHGAGPERDEAPPYSLRQAADEFLSSGVAGLAPDTVDYYDWKLATVCEFIGALDINALTRADVDRYVTDRLKTVRAHSVIKELVALRRTLKHAVAHGHTEPAVVLVVPTLKSDHVPRERHLTVKEAERLLDGIHRAPLRNWVLLAIYSGGRRREVNTLRWDAVDWEGGWVTMPKTKTRSRQVSLSPEFRTLLEGLLAQSVPGQETIIKPRKHPTSGLHDVCDRIGLPRVGANDLRRSFGSWLAQKGHSLQVIAKLMGNSAAVAEKHYAHLVDDQLRRAMADLPRGLATRPRIVESRKRR